MKLTCEEIELLEEMGNVLEEHCVILKNDESGIFSLYTKKGESFEAPSIKELRDDVVLFYSLKNVCK